MRWLRLAAVLTVGFVSVGFVAASYKGPTRSLPLLPVCAGTATLGGVSTTFASATTGNTLVAFGNPQNALIGDMQARGRGYVWADVWGLTGSCVSASSGVADSATTPHLLRHVTTLGTSNGGLSNVIGRAHTPLDLDGDDLVGVDVSVVPANPSGGSGSIFHTHPFSCTDTKTSVEATWLHELNHLYGFNHDNNVLTMLNTTGMDFFSCGHVGDLLIMKMDSAAVHGLYYKYGERSDEDTPDFGVSNMIKTKATIDSLEGTGKNMPSDQSLAIGPSTLFPPTAVAEFSVMNPRNRTNYAGIRFFWVPNPTPGYNYRDLRATDDGPANEMDSNVDYHLVLWVEESSDLDQSDNQLMLPIEVSKLY